ncbi:MAG: threonylcarbamoyl-AMP synthase [Flavobacteriales bacterium]|nr:threonylcarbamoyl-AMP synthase [Flavobacteriales bacterium]NQX98122.1 threonylcarbamoyl-AMP synthase [Flavobacteriales bacterium]
MKQEIHKTIEVLKAGGIILYPTDTVWGIGCDATNEKAVQKIYKLKQRSDAKSLIIIVANDRMLNYHVKDVPELAWDIIDISKKPTTIIYTEGNHLADNVMAEDNSIAIRMIKEGFAHQLAFNFRKPIVSTSANISESSTPSSFNEISNEIKNNVDFIVDVKFNTGNKKPSSLMKLGLYGEIKILRS